MRKLDRTDIGILNSLQENARITNADLARSVNLSPTPCFNRVKAMEERMARGGDTRAPTVADLSLYLVDNARGSGLTVTAVREDIRNVPVIARSAGETRLDPSRLADFSLISRDGRQMAYVRWNDEKLGEIVLADARGQARRVISARPARPTSRASVGACLNTESR